MSELMEQFQVIENKMNNEGLGYYIMNYTDSSSMPDKESKRLFNEAVIALTNFTNYIQLMAKD